MTTGRGKRNVRDEDKGVDMVFVKEDDIEKAIKAFRPRA